MFKIIARTGSAEGSSGLCPVPDEPISLNEIRLGIPRASATACTQWGDLFTARQKVVLVELGELISNIEGPLREGCLALWPSIEQRDDPALRTSSWLGDLAIDGGKPCVCVAGRSRIPANPVIEEQERESELHAPGVDAGRGRPLDRWKGDRDRQKGLH